MITIVVGTNRKDSVTQQVALQYADILKGKGVESTIFNLQDLPHDFIKSALYENVEKNKQFNQTRTQINQAQSLCLSY